MGPFLSARRGVWARFSGLLCVFQSKHVRTSKNGPMMSCAACSPTLTDCRGANPFGRVTFGRLAGGERTRRNVHVHVHLLTSYLSQRRCSVLPEQGHVKPNNPEIPPRNERGFFFCVSVLILLFSSTLFLVCFPGAVSDCPVVLRSTERPLFPGTPLIVPQTSPLNYSNSPTCTKWSSEPRQTPDKGVRVCRESRLGFVATVHSSRLDTCKGQQLYSWGGEGGGVSVSYSLSQRGYRVY